MSGILVTGGAGYIGSHVCKQMAEGGARVAAYDSLDRSSRDAVRWCDLIQGDIRDTSRLEKAIRRYKVDTIVHLAALINVRESFNIPDAYWAVNVGGMISVVAAAVSSGVNNVVFSSSCTVYGVPSKQPISVDAVLSPICPYGRTKLACEQVLVDCALKYRLKYHILRYFNVAGADPEGDLGESHRPEEHIIPRILKGQVQQHDECITIYGTEHDTEDGTCIRDFIHVHDVSSAHVQAVKLMRNGNPSRTLNIGLGVGSSVRDVIVACERVTVQPVRHKVGPAHIGDPPVLVADPGDCWNYLEMKPKYTSLDDMVKHAWQWYKNQAQEAGPCETGG